VYSQIQEYIQSVIQGVNTTIFAYGQTGSGKTYTMFGKDWTTNDGINVMHAKDGSKNLKIRIATLHDEGIIPRAIDSLFNEIDPTMTTVYC